MQGVVKKHKKEYSKNLWLTSTKLTTKQLNSILTKMPKERLHKLEIISINVNRFFFVLPQIVFECVNLKYLDISFTEITEIPDKITLFVNLKELFANCTPINKVPYNIVLLKRLKRIDLQFTLLPTRFRKRSRCCFDHAQEHLNEMSVYYTYLRTISCFMWCGKRCNYMGVGKHIWRMIGEQIKKV